MTETTLSDSTQTPTVPLDDPGERERLLSEWMAAFPGSDPIAQGYILQAVDALIDRRRVERVRATVRGDKVRTAGLFWERNQEDTVTHDLRLFNTDPGAGLVRLLRTAAGCRTAIATWEAMAKNLAENGTGYGEDKMCSIQLQGFSACINELVYSEDAYLTWVDCLAAQPNPKQREIDLILEPSRIPKSLRDRDVAVWPRDPVACRVRLKALLNRKLPRLKAFEADLRVKYEEPSKAEADLSALAFDNKAEMQLIRMQRIHEQAYHQATTALMKHRKQTAALRRPTASQPLDQSMLFPPRRVRAPRVSDSIPAAGDRAEPGFLRGGPLPTTARLDDSAVATTPEPQGVEASIGRRTRGDVTSLQDKE